MATAAPAGSAAPAAAHSGQRRLLSALWTSLKPWRRRLLAAVALLVLAKLTAVTVPLVLKAIVDRLSQPQSLELAPVFLLLAYALLRFGSALFTELRDTVFARVTHETVSGFTLRAFDRLHALGAAFHSHRRTGAVTRDVDRGSAAIGVLLGVALFTVLPTLVEITAVLGILAAGYNFGFTAIILAIFTLYAGWTLVLINRRAPRQRAMNELASSASGRLVDSLLNHETVKYYANESFESRLQQRLLRDWAGAATRNQYALSRMHIGQSGIIALGVGAVMLLAGQEVVAGAMTVGDLVLVNAYILQVSLPLNVLGFSFRQARDAGVDAERLFALLDHPDELASRPGLAALNVSHGEVRFERVNFGYEPGRQILWDVDFSIAPGGTVAVVGGSGSGKSTLARLLFRFYDPHSGRVSIDGHGLREVSAQSLREAIGIVPQDTLLFNDTIAYNIAYGRVGAPLAEVVQAARAAHIHHFIAALPEQYDTRVGERGLMLSGGEKQRIAIARAILKNPKILVFDEATSALDSKSERAIQAQLEALARQRTTLIIAHRLSTVIGADEILVMEHGRIAERGRHEDLLARHGVYAQMWNLQQQQRKLEKAEQRLARQPVNLAALTAHVIDGLRPAIEERNIRLYSMLGSESARVTGDPSTLQQTLWDLLNHAVTVSPPGGRVALKLERAGALARLSVADSAEGGPSTVTPLDLLRVRKAAEQHHGAFRSQPAAPGPGSEYVLELPLRALDEDGGLPALGRPAAPRISLDGLRVLAIDDQKEARELLTGVLGAHGAQAQSAASGAEALERLCAASRAEWPDVLICDIALGEHEDGYSVIAALRALEAERRTPLAERLPAIALSGHARPEDRMRALLAGFQIHLAKPADPNELVATVASLAPPRHRAPPQLAQRR